MTTPVERVDAPLPARCPNLKAVCNIAVRFNNIASSSETTRRAMAMPAAQNLVAAPDHGHAAQSAEPVIRREAG